jgi:predicted acyltransferase
MTSKNTNSAAPSTSDRLLSLDAYRGLTMFLLVASGAGLYRAMSAPEFQASWLSPLFTQFTHHPWNGLRFWDLVQPYFMFIVGVAMPFSFGKRWARGATDLETFKHALYRSVVLLALGASLHIVSAGHLVLGLWNVLAQLSFTYFVAYLLMRKSFGIQLVTSLGLILLSDVLYRVWPLPGYNQPFTPDQNFGSWVDMLLMGKLSSGHWVVFNAVPTAAHTIWGVLAGYLLLSKRSPLQKVKLLVLSGIIALFIGYALDPFVPIIKRICTSSFVITSGGWCLITLALFYWIIDIKHYHRWCRFAVVFGLNPIFIYLFSNLGGNRWLSTIVHPFADGILGWTGAAMVVLITAVVVLWMDWYLVHWLDKHRIYFRI